MRIAVLQLFLVVARHVPSDLGVAVDAAGLAEPPGGAVGPDGLADLLRAQVFEQEQVSAERDQEQRARLVKRAASRLVADLPPFAFGGVQWRFTQALGAGYNGLTLRAQPVRAEPHAALAGVPDVAVKYSPDEAELRRETATYLKYFATAPADASVVPVYNSGGERVLVMGLAKGREEAQILDAWKQDFACGESAVAKEAYPSLRRMLVSNLRAAEQVLRSGFANWDQSIFNTFYDDSALGEDPAVGDAGRTTFLDWGFCVARGEPAEQPPLYMLFTLVDGVTRRLATDKLGKLWVRQSLWATRALAERDAIIAEMREPAAEDFDLTADRARALAAELAELGDEEQDLTPKQQARLERYTDYRKCKAWHKAQQDRLRKPSPDRQADARRARRQPRQPRQRPWRTVRAEQQKEAEKLTEEAEKARVEEA